MSRLHLATLAAALLFTGKPAPAQFAPDAPQPKLAAPGSPVTVASIQQALAAITAAVSKPGNDYAADAQRLKAAHDAQVMAFVKTRDAEWHGIEVATVEQIRQYKVEQILTPSNMNGTRPAPPMLLDLPKVQASFAAATRTGLEKIQLTQAQEDRALKAQYTKSASAAITLALGDVGKLQAQVTRQNPSNLQDILALLANYSNSLQVLQQKVNNS
jgi:hypothetical protein